MWESPIYIFEKKKEKEGGNIEKEKIIIDVTGSAPVMADPGDYLKSVFKDILKGKKPENTLIIDFGAAKLRNSLHLLKKGYQVRAVEFPELANRMPQAKSNWKKAEKNPRFKKLIFPRDFYSLKEKADVILLVNVMNVMPLSIERLTALALCRKKIKEGGLLYWLNWKPASANPKIYSEDNKLNDGWYRGKGRTKKTFHVEWTKEEAFEMLAATGFSYAEDIKIEKTSGSQSYVFRADRSILIEDSLQIKEVEEGKLKHDPKKIIPEKDNVSLIKLYLEELKKLDPGPENSSIYKNLAIRMLGCIFNNQLKNPEVEVPISEGLGKVDGKFKNKNEPGFFKNAKEMHDIKCPSVFIECKNYSEDISNPEFDQLSGRLDNPNRGQLGILTCRNIQDKKRVIKHCKEKLMNEKCLIVLEDSDFEELIDLKLEEGDDAINDFMENKLDEIID